MENQGKNMGIFNQLKLSDSTVVQIEWEMTPDLAFCTFTAKGLREELTNTSERICYFFIDNWGDEPRLYLMERGVRHVHILAEIKAPQQMLVNCIVNQGGTPSSRDNYPIDSALKDWLLTEVMQVEDSPFLVPAHEEHAAREDMGAELPHLGENNFSDSIIILPAENDSLADDQIGPLLVQWNFYDAELNPQGSFHNVLADTGDGLTVVDERTSLMWQRFGLDLSSSRTMRQKIEQLNNEGLAGYHDWRIPTLEEAMSLMERTPNEKGVYLHPCFSKEQPFIFIATRRTPTGYWFVDYKQGKVYWSSGTVPGGFCRLCRNITADS